MTSTGFDLLTASQILETTFPEPRWIVPGLIPSGLTLLAGKPKSGKSWLALEIAQAVGSGTPLWGMDIEQRPVLYLALEDVPRRIKERMELQGWSHESACDFMFASEFRKSVGSLSLQGKQSTRGAHSLAQYIESERYGLVIVDTLSRAGLGDALSFDDMTQGVGPLQELAGRLDCALLLLDHHTKSIGETPDAVANILGSSAKAACADTLLGLYRKPGESKAKLCGTGRDIENVAWELDFDSSRGVWELIGQAAGIELTKRRQEIVDALRSLGSATLAGLAKHLGQDRANTRTRLLWLIDNGQVRMKKQSGTTYYELGAEDPFNLAMLDKL